jgi:hypothetical protein
VNADCDNGAYCDGTETCITTGNQYVCTNGTDPCAAGETCDETGNVCVGTECNSNGDCVDALFCNGTETCVNGNCEAGTAPCAAGETCDEATDACVTTPTEFAVTIDGCPTGSTASGTVVDFTAVPANATGSLWYVWTGANATTNGAATATLTATTTVTVSVTAYDYVDTNTNGMWNTGEETDTATADCDVTVQFTAALIVDAGGLSADRAAIGQYLSGAPVTAGNNALNGSANQQGVPADAIATTWSVDSKPATSGSVSFSNGSELQTAFTVAPPAKAGTYVFRLTGTNENSGETDFDTVSLELLDVPTVRIKSGFKPVRLNLLRGSAGRTMTLSYTSDSAGTIEIFDGLGTLAANLITSVAINASTNGVATDVDVTIPATGTRETNNPGRYALWARITDTVGPDVLAGSVLVDGGAGALTSGILYASRSWIETRDTSTVPVINVFTTVGELPLGPNAANTILHNGVGDGAPELHPAVALIDTRDAVRVADINGDGFGDLIVLEATQIGVVYGDVAVWTDDGAAGGGDNWAGASFYDITLTEGTLNKAFATGDFNDDGNVDVVVVDSTAATTCQVYLLSGATSATMAAASRNWTAAAADYSVAPLVQAGDVGGDGIDDIVAAFPGYDDDLGTAAAVDDGAVFVIYGKASTLPTISLPVDDTAIHADTVSGLSGGTRWGDRLLGPDDGTSLYGTALRVGSFDGGADDVVVCEGATTTNVNLFLGGASGGRISTTAAKTFTQLAAGDMAGGYVVFGDLTDDGNNDIILASPAKDVVYIVASTVPTGTGLGAASIITYNTTLAVNGTAGAIAAGDTMAVYDVNGDDKMDLLVGDNVTGARVLLFYGPITTTLGASDVDRVYTGDNIGDAIIFGDVNGDATVDMSFLDATGAQLYTLFGLD